MDGRTEGTQNHHGANKKQEVRVLLQPAGRHCSSGSFVPTADKCSENRGTNTKSAAESRESGETAPVTLQFRAVQGEKVPKVQKYRRRSLALLSNVILMRRVPLMSLLRGHR